MSESAGSGAGQREVAYRMFAAEFEAADYEYSESDEERAPNYVITPTGARSNRLFIVGVLTEVEQVSEDVLRARVVDPTGGFVLYAGQYQPDEQAFLEGAQTPMYIAVTGKARTFTPDDSEQVYTSIRPESISEVDTETRDRWTVQAAEQTIERIRWMTLAMTLDADANVRELLGERGADDGLAHGIGLALDHYGTTPTALNVLRNLALEATRVVAGEADEVESISIDPGRDGDVTLADLRATVGEPSALGAEAEPSGTTETASSAASTETDSDETATVESEIESESAEIDETEVGTTSSEETTSTGGQDDPVVEEFESDLGDETEPGSETSPEEPTVTDDGADDGPGEFEATDLGSGKSGSEKKESEDSDAEKLESEALESPEEFELEEETREEIEEEYGTEFQSGTEVDEPGSADIETPDPAELADEPADTETADVGTETYAETADIDTETATETTDSGTETTEDRVEVGTDSAGDEATESSDTDGDSERDDDSDGGPEADDDSEAGGAADIDDPQEAVLDVMAELDDGDGADREELVAAMDDRFGLDRETVEDAIESALMDGACYEPNDSTLKPI